MAHIHQQPGIPASASLGRRLDICARSGFPACITVLLMLLTMAPLGFAGQAMLLPAVALCCVFFWSVFRPDAMPPPVVFLIGLLLDLLGYFPLGVGVFTLLALHGFAMRCAGRSRDAVSLGFGSSSPARPLPPRVDLGLAMLLTFRLLPPDPAFSCCPDPRDLSDLAILFTGAHRSIAGPERA